jgi:hypothetical protein
VEDQRACQLSPPADDWTYMSNLIDNANPLAADLSSPIEVGEPDVAGPLSVYPLFGPAGSLEYTAFAATKGEVVITELAGGPSVNDLMVDNGGGKAVLLYEGEEILGAQQNRVIDLSILVAAGSKVQIPVSCVEQGRWDGRRRRDRFRPSRQAADPKLRRLKNKRARMKVEAGMEARADQAEVWDEVADRGREMDASSPTAAMHDIYEVHRDRLAEIRAGIALREGQRGSVAVIDGRIAMLDYVGRADVYAVLQPAIVEGYALDALAQERSSDRTNKPPVEIGTVRGFVLLACDAPVASRTPGPGLGETARFAANGTEGSALIAEGELVQMTAFPSDADEPRPGPDGGPTPAPSRINRPSRRRGR